MSLETRIKKLESLLTTQKVDDELREKVKSWIIRVRILNRVKPAEFNKLLIAEFEGNHEKHHELEIAYLKKYLTSEDLNIPEDKIKRLVESWRNETPEEAYERNKERWDSVARMSYENALTSKWQEITGIQPVMQVAFRSSELTGEDGLIWSNRYESDDPEALEIVRKWEEIRKTYSISDEQTGRELASKLEDNF